MPTVKITSESSRGMIIDAHVEVEFEPGDEAKALEALDAAYHEARRRIDATTPCNTEAPTPEHPSEVIDGDGDVWRHEGHGLYRRAGYSFTATVESLREEYGIRRVIP
jgi:hypothetical protein